MTDKTIPYLIEQQVAEARRILSQSPDSSDHTQQRAAIILLLKEIADELAGSRMS